MNFNLDTIINVLIAMIIFKVLDKLILDSLLEKIPSMGGSSYEVG